MSIIFSSINMCPPCMLADFVHRRGLLALLGGLSGGAGGSGTRGASGGEVGRDRVVLAEGGGA